MICPSCKSDTIIVEYNKIELDYCPNCQGVWFDSGELELLLEPMGLNSLQLFLSNILNSPETKSLEKRRRCPICAQKMKKLTIGQEPKSLIDACPQGDGIWFDRGELSQLVVQSAGKLPQKSGSQQQIITFLAEVFHTREQAT